MKDIYITSSIIENPQTNCIYHMPYNHKEIIITFSGNTKADFVDVSTDIAKSIEPLTVAWYPGADMILFPRAILPKPLNTMAFSPILAWSDVHGIVQVSSINYNLDSNQSKLKANKIAIPIPINQTIASTYQPQFNIPLHVGQFPIFTEFNRPHYAFLAAVYEQFMSFNTKEKLELQNKNSTDLCHVRAHFSSLLLQKLYNVPTMKIFKFWNPQDWQSFGVGKCWSFHTATVIMDDKTNLWVWDPWIGNNLTLTTVNEWLYPSDEPNPISFALSNANIIEDYEKGRRPDGLLFMSCMDLDDARLTAFQAVASDALPNNLERPILSNTQIIANLIEKGAFGTVIKNRYKSSDRSKSSVTSIGFFKNSRQAILPEQASLENDSKAPLYNESR